MNIIDTRLSNLESVFAQMDSKLDIIIQKLPVKPPKLPPGLHDAPADKSQAQFSERLSRLDVLEKVFVLTGSDTIQAVVDAVVQKPKESQHEISFQKSKQPDPVIEYKIGAKNLHLPQETDAGDILRKAPEHLKPADAIETAKPQNTSKLAEVDKYESDDEDEFDESLEVNPAMIEDMLRRAQKLSFSAEDVANVHNFNNLSFEKKTALLWKLWPQIWK